MTKTEARSRALLATSETESAKYDWAVGRTYYGVSISRTGRNSMGLRWEAHVNRLLRADTLDGIKELIRKELGK